MKFAHPGLRSEQAPCCFPPDFEDRWEWTWSDPKRYGSSTTFRVLECRRCRGHWLLRVDDCWDPAEDRRTEQVFGDDLRREWCFVPLTTTEAVEISGAPGLHVEDPVALTEVCARIRRIVSSPRMILVLHEETTAYRSKAMEALTQADFAAEHPESAGRFEILRDRYLLG